MDPIALVDFQIEAGQTFLDRLADERIVVDAALWVKLSEVNRWTLYIVTPLLDERGIREAIRQVIDVLRSIGEIGITSSDFSVVGTNDPLGQAAIDLARKYPNGLPPHVRLTRLGGKSIDDIYLYSLHKVNVSVYGLAFQGDPTGALHLSLEPHNPKCSLIVENDGRRNEYPARIGIDSIVAAPAGATLERDERGILELAWDLHGKRVRSDANEVWSLADLSLHGFKLVGNAYVGSHGGLSP